VDLSGKLAIVTGASRGIGRALARELAKSGCGLILIAYEEEDLAVLTGELRTAGAYVTSIAADLSVAESRTRLIHRIREHPESPDLLVNNAGMGGDFGRFEFRSMESIERTIAVNISAFIHLTHELIPVLRERVRAKIVNISSGVARLPYPGLAVYGATKAFVSSFSESLSAELAGTNVDVLCFHPGFTETSFLTTSKMDMRRIPAKFLHTPDFVAERIVRKIKSDACWAYSDSVTGFSAWFGALLPAGLKTSIFRNLFWRLPDEK
jgi:short-subunit dehydrogenase